MTRMAPSGKVRAMSPGPLLASLGASEREPPEDSTEVTKIPKSFLTAVLLPGGPYAGQLARPCPCGRPIDFDGDEIFNLIRWPDGELLIYHEGCIADPNDA